MATYGYVRVSTPRQAEASGESLEVQERKIRAVALFRGETIAEIVKEPGESGSIALDERTAGGPLFGRLAAGDTLVVSKLDRAFRSAIDALAQAERLQARGVRLIIADMGTDPVTGNGISKLFFTMLAAFAEFERSRIIERTTEGRRAKAARGGYIGGKVPFGYRVEGEGEAAKLVEDAQEQAAIAEIKALGHTMSLRKLATLVSEKFHVRISHEGVRRVLDDHFVTPPAA